MSKVLYVVDTSNWLYKFSSVYHLTRSINGVEVNVSALYGIVRAVKANPFSDIMFALDGTPNVSNRLLPSYKGQRSKEDDTECRVPPFTIMKVIASIAPLLGKNIFIAVSPGQEADQVISSVAHIVSGSAPSNWEFISTMNHCFEPVSSDRRLLKFVEGAEIKEIDYSCYDKCIIATTDSDIYQLQRLKDVFIDTSTNGSKVQFQEESPAAVKYVKPSAIVGYKMLCGDTSDNVPKLKLHVKNEVLIDIINSELDTLEKCREFNTAVQTGKIDVLPERLKSLAKTIIKEKEQSLLSKNMAVVALVFYSAPYILSYPSYKGSSILKKYRIKL